MYRAILLFCLAAAPLSAQTNFTGKWSFDSGASDTQGLNSPAEPALAITQDGTAIHCNQYTLNLNRTETRYVVAGEHRSSIAKWEGAALLVNTIVTGPADYTLMDRWTLSRDGSTLRIVRQVVRSAGEREGTLVYRAEGFHEAAPAQARQPAQSSQSSQAMPRRQAMTTAPEPSEPRQYLVPMGTRIPLTLRNPVDSKHSHEGDHVYLEVAYPIAQNGRIVIPRGAFVNGTVTDAKAAGALKGKGELYIRFDTLMLPNGVTRDFRARAATADQEGKITGSRDGSRDVHDAATGGGIGAAGGAIGGRAAGATVAGAGIGAAAGVAGGLLLAHVHHRADATLPKGTTVEMILDRDLVFQDGELGARW